jgi:exonuclease III
MRIMSWNCRGLGNLRTVRELCRLTKQKKPAMVFLMETKLHKTKMENVCYKVGYPNMFLVDRIGKSGGLALLWNDEISVSIQNFSRRHINGVIENLGRVENWKFTGFYGHPDVAKRHEAWALLRHLASISPYPWVCVGDFNEIVEKEEKWGGGTRSNSQMEAFR